MVIRSVPDQAQERLLKAVEVAEVLNISRALTYQLLKCGDIPSIRIRSAIRVLPKDLEKYIQECRICSSSGVSGF